MKSRSTLKIILLWGVVSVVAVMTAGSGLCSQPRKVAVIPFHINSPQDLGFLQNGLFDMLFSRLSDQGKVNVLDRPAIDEILAQARKTGKLKGVLTEDTARILGADIGVDYILFGSLTHFGESVSLDASMVDMAGKKPTLTFFEQSNNMGDVIPMVNTFAGDVNVKVFDRNIANELYAGPQKPAAQQSAAPGSAQGGFINLQQTGASGFQTHLKFKGQINAMAAGDLDDNGVVQVVTATDYEIFIYSLKQGKLVKEKQLDFASTNRIVGLDIADINKNGFPEIFVTSLNIHRNGLQSFVLEFSGSAYKTLTDDESYYFRVIKEKSGRHVLIGQKYAAHPFKGDIYTMTSSGSSYVRDKKLKMPKSASALSLARGPVTGKDADESVLINEHGRLSVVSSAGNIEWQGNTTFGGTAHYFLLERDDPDASFQKRVYLNPRIEFYDIGDDGKQEIFAVQNQEVGGGSLGKYKRFTKGSLDILTWNGIALAPVVKTRSVQGWISDFAIADIDEDGVDELWVSVNGRAKLLVNLQKQTSNIISYELD